MKFHSVHGSSITLTDGKSKATRSDSQFCKGIVFSDQPVKVGHKVSIELSCTQLWSGALRIGFTTTDPARHNPADLPKYSFPCYAKKEGFWVRPISESWIRDGDELMFYITPNGHVPLFINREHRGSLLLGLPTDKMFWVIFDIYGNTNGIKVVKPDDAPREIMAQGPEAIRAFESACLTGMVPVYHSRLMLVGQHRVGKTRLKRTLLGHKTEDTLLQTSGIDLSTLCCFRVGSDDGWSSIASSPDDFENATEKDHLYTGDSASIEDEYNEALAMNIVQELVYQKRSKPAPNTSQHKTKPPSRDSLRSNPTSNSNKKVSVASKPSSASGASKLSDIPSDMLKEVPERVVQLVQQMLDTGLPDVKAQQSAARTTQPADGTKMLVNLWDFAGREEYYSLQQVFLTSRAIYVFVFNLTDELEETVPSQEEDGGTLSTLDHLDFWLRSIYAHASTTSSKQPGQLNYFPRVIIVGTHKDCLHTDNVEETVEEKFSQISEFVVGKPYVQHLVTPFYAVNNTLDDEKVVELRNHIEKLIAEEPYMGERMPLRWMKFEHEISALTLSGANYASYDQVTEVADGLGITDYKEVMTMLEFYHDRGTIIYYGHGNTAIDNLLRNTIILSPQWLINMFKHVISTDCKPEDKWNLISDKWSELHNAGVLDEMLLDTLWQEARNHKPLLVALMHKFDLICQRLPPAGQCHGSDYVQSKTFYVPARFPEYSCPNKLYTVQEGDATFYIDFSGFLPNGLLQRLLCRTICWCQDQGDQNPYYLYKTVARFYLDIEHDLVLERLPNAYARIKVVILRASVSDSSRTQNNQTETTTAVNPHVCAKVRQFLENSLSDLRETWMKRLSFSTLVLCPCLKVCELHKTAQCQQLPCQHFLNLDECLANKVVMCGDQRIRTVTIKKSFPEPLQLGFAGPVLAPMSVTDTCGNIEKHCTPLPGWLKTAAKLLNMGESGKDWNALGKELGYKQNQLNTFNDDLNPGLALLADWIMSTGNTGLSVDMLLVYLEKLDRDDVLDIIHKAQELDQEPAQVFLSYQWDMQDEVKCLRDRLERSGYTCWMDIGQLGGGDHLYTCIDQALRHCKVVVSCISPKYVISSHCVKELSLADLLRKPIIPVMLEPTVWPPPGAMAVILSQHVYINMKGIGGHGGTGLHADKQDKYREILQRIGLHARPHVRHFNKPDQGDRESRRSHFINQDIISTNYSNLDYSDHYSTSSSINTLLQADPQLVPLQTYNQQAVQHQRPNVNASNPSTQEAHVQHCRICTIL